MFLLRIWRTKSWSMIRQQRTNIISQESANCCSRSWALLSGGSPPIPLHKPLPLARNRLGPDALFVSNLDYYILSKLGRIEIEWTRSLYAHLTLNRQTRTIFEEYARKEDVRREDRLEVAVLDLEQQLHVDPLLDRLCGTDWSEQSVYDKLNAPIPVALPDPHDWRTLWHDRRGIARFWTIWAVVSLAVIATLLAIFGLFLAAAQVAGRFE
nr:hypothetical protein CFP56_20684 [Quercus suber]